MPPVLGFSALAWGTGMFALLSGEPMRFVSFNAFPAFFLLVFGRARVCLPKPLDAQTPSFRVVKFFTCRTAQNGYHKSKNSVLKTAPTVTNGEDLTTTAKQVQSWLLTA